MKLNLRDLDLKGKKVLMRVDFNVPLDHGTISDDSRLRAALPSIKYILNHGASLILMSHLGRPKGLDPSLSLAPCVKKLAELLKTPIKMAKDCVGIEVEKMAQNLQSGEVMLLENLRFHPGEEAPEKYPEFVKQLANLGDCYVNDAFGTAHRAHASTAVITKFFPNKSAMGFLIEKEIEKLTPLLTDPKRPFYALMGGAKVDSKLGVIKQLIQKVDLLFVGGGMAYTFLKREGKEIGSSLCQDPQLIKDIPREKIRLPLDFVIADKLANDAEHKISVDIPKGWMGVDIGPQTILAWSEELKKGATIFWNGPLGVFEMSNFAEGTKKIAKMLAALHAKTVIGGGETVAAIEKLGLQNKFDHVSTGGGASLEFLEFGHLPGIDALSEKT